MDQVPCQMRVNLDICEVCLLISLLIEKGNQHKKYRPILGYGYFIRKRAFYLERLSNFFHFFQPLLLAEVFFGTIVHVYS